MCRKIPQIRLNFAAMVKYALIIPVFNRPDEVDELLQSLTAQTFTDFEVVVVEDGSAIPCKDVVGKYAGSLTIHYYTKENGGPGKARNYGVARTKAPYVIVLDSDAVLPPGYLAAIEAELAAAPCDAFGGPDRAHPSFTPMQKAINYAMTSFFTTGGIRGGKKKLDKFYPRSFNMGVRRTVYAELGGFSPMRFGEDIDFSTRIFETGHSCRLFPEAWVWHKRRTDLKKFFKQVHNSGIARINLTRLHPGTLKLVHLLPSVFTAGLAFLLLVTLAGLAAGCLHALWALTPPLLFALLVLVDATRAERSLSVGVRAVAASFVQLCGYGSGFLRAWWRQCVRGKSEFEAFKGNFYK